MHVPKEAFRKQLFVLLPVYINVFMMACTVGWLPNAIYFFNEGSEVSATALQCTLIASYNELGRMVFAIPGGMLVDKFGRKKIIICTGILHFSSWLTLSLDSSIITIYIVRFAQGIASALSNATSLISIGEIASPEIRGKLIGLYQTCFSAGMISPAVIAALFSSYHILSYCTAALSFLFFISIYWVMETPSQLITESKLHNAKENLKKIRMGYSESDITIEFDKLLKYIEEEKLRRKATTWLQFLNTKAIRKPLIISTLLNFFTFMSGRILINAYMTVIYPSVEYVHTQYYPLISQLSQFVITICMACYIDKYPRRSMYMVGSSLIAILMAFCSLTEYFWIEYDEVISKWSFLFGNVLTGMVFMGFVLPMCNASKSEILPQAVKGFGGSLGVIAQTVANIIIYQLYRIIGNDFGLYYLFAIFSLNSIILCLLVYFYLPEGRGRMLADLQMNFKNGTHSDNNKSKSTNEI